MTNQNGHLTDAEINQLNKNRLTSATLYAALRHVEKCQSCRQRVSPPTQAEIDQIFFKTSSIILPATTRAKGVFGDWRMKIRFAALSVALLVVLIGSLVLIVTLDKNSPNIVAEIETNDRSQSLAAVPENKAGDESLTSSVSSINQAAVKAERRNQTVKPNINQQRQDGSLSKSAAIHFNPPTSPPQNQPRASSGNQKNQSRIIGNTRISDPAIESEIAQLSTSVPTSVASLRIGGQMTTRGDKADANRCQNENGFKLKFPVSQTVIETEPIFVWESSPSVKNYQISISDAEYDEIAADTVEGNRYKIKKPLKRGQIYLWKVTAQVNHVANVLPAVPQPPVLFRVADKQIAEKAIELEKKENKLELAAFYAKEGLLTASEKVLQDILRKEPNSKPAKRLFAAVKKWRYQNQEIVYRCGGKTIFDQEVK